MRSGIVLIYILMGLAVVAVVLIAAVLPEGAARAANTETTTATISQAQSVEAERMAQNGDGAMTEGKDTSTYRELTPEEERVIVHKGTEQAFTGEYDEHFAKGVYTCRRCGAMLYRSEDKFRSDCGWPAFDDEIPGAVKHVPDADGRRTEIVCANCGAHLGHVFIGEQFTAKNTRHCVNSISMDFLPMEKVKFGRAIFAAGCFWGVEYQFQTQPGVLETTVGYIGGTKEKPTYEEVCGHDTGHAEAVEVIYDPVRISFERLAKMFFEMHDPTQKDRQGPDIGSQYRSEIFYTNEEQAETARRLIEELKSKGMNVVTRVTPAGMFWPAEDYHQDWFMKKGTPAVCHTRQKLW